MLFRHRRPAAMLPVCAFLLGLALPARAVEVGVALDGQFLAQRDLQASPLVYDGVQGGLVVDSRQAAGGWRFEQELIGRLGGLHAAGVGPRSLSTVREDPVTGEPEVSAFREPTATMGGAVGLEGRRVLGGGGVELGLRIDGDALNSFGVALGQWAWTSLELGPSATWSTRPFDHARLRLHLALPLVAVVTRYPDNLNPLLPDRSTVGGFFASGTRVASLDSHQRVAVDAELELSRERRWRWTAGLRADWLHDAIPDHLYRLRVALRTGVRLGPRRSS